MPENSENMNGNGEVGEVVAEAASAPDTSSKEPEKAESETRKRKVSEGGDAENPATKKSKDDADCVDLDETGSADGDVSREGSSVVAADNDDSVVSAGEVRHQSRRARVPSDEDSEDDGDSDIIALDDGGGGEDDEEDLEDEEEEDDDDDDDSDRGGRRLNPEVLELSDDEEEEEADPSAGPRPMVVPDWPHVHHCVLIMRLRRPFYIVGNYEIKTAKGTVELMGMTLAPGDDYVQVYSSRLYGAIPIKINNSETEDSELLEKLQTKECSWRKQDVVLILRRLQNSLTQHVQHYFPNSLGLSKQLVSAGEMTYAQLNFINCIGLYENQKSFFKESGLRLLDLEPAEFIRTSVLGKTDVPDENVKVVAACGGKGVGKSTVLRMLVNMILSNKKRDPNRRVLYLDCDPGQSEFSISGSVSLVEVTKPMLGPAFTHNMKPIGAYFLGHLTIASCPNDYLQAIENLVNLKNTMKEYDDAFIFVNTMGWTRGLGIDLLVEVLRILKPNVVIQLESSSDTHNLPTMDCAFVSLHKTTLKFVSDLPKSGEKDAETKASDTGEMPYDFQLVQIKSSSEADPNMRTVEGYRAPISRDLMTLAYFSQLQPGVARPSPLTTVVPYRVPWSSVAIQSCHTCIPVSEVLNVVVGSLVALCKVDPKDMIAPKDKTLPRILRYNVLPECLGYGYVRAIDPNEKYFYVITPLLPKRLESVNCFGIGMIAVPQMMLDEAPHYFGVSPGEILAPQRGDGYRPAMHTGVVPRTFKKRKQPPGTNA